MTRKTKQAETEPAAEAALAPITAFKGFDKNLACRGYQYEIGTTFKHEGDVEACASGFHSCENPLDVFGYYSPGESRFCEVELGGVTARHSDDTKIASAEITIKAEIKLPDFVARAIKYVTERATSKEGEHATGDRSAASATGYQSAASATGYQSAASATGDQSAASATGYQSAASATGYQSAASATGYRSAASATGDRSAAMACGYQGRVSGKQGNALFLVERDVRWEIIAAWAGIVGRDGIEEGVFYILRDGKPTPA